MKKNYSEAITHVINALEEDLTCNNWLTVDGIENRIWQERKLNFLTAIQAFNNFKFGDKKNRERLKLECEYQFNLLKASIQIFLAEEYEQIEKIYINEIAGALKSLYLKKNLSTASGVGSSTFRTNYFKLSNSILEHEFLELLEIFKTEIEEANYNLQKSYQEGNMKLVEFYAHKIRGLTEVLRNEELSELARIVELCAEDKKQEIKPEITMIDTISSDILLAIQQYNKS